MASLGATQLGSVVPFEYDVQGKTKYQHYYFFVGRFSFKAGRISDVLPTAGTLIMTDFVGFKIVSISCVSVEGKGVLMVGIMPLLLVFLPSLHFVLFLVSRFPLEAA